MSSSTSRRRNTSALTLALPIGLYLAWVLVTYLLEGRIQTLLRPEATFARFGYAVVANLMIGVIGAVWMVRVLSGSRAITPQQAGFRGIRHAFLAVLVGGMLGFLVYAIQGLPTSNPMVLINAFAQVLVVSVAEILVCWAVIGSVCESLVRGSGRWIGMIAAAIVASILFGVYHFAHSPPFNTVGLVAFLTVVGLVTSVFFFVSRDVYGTIVFHNFFGVLGVVQALESAENLTSFERPVVSVLVMAVVAVILLIVTHVLVLSDDTAQAD